MPGPLVSPSPLLSFGPAGATAPGLGLPHSLLAGEAVFSIAAEALSPRPGGVLWQHFADAGGRLAAATCRLPARGGADLPARAEAAYRELLALEDSTRQPLARLWNFIPAIHAEVDGLENYRRFNQGRALAFTAHCGDDAPRRMPAATGIGTPGDELVLVARFGAPGLRHLENPHQLPAWRYPAEHGPRPPSFARATVAADGSESWLAGTAAVLGHESRGTTLTEQLDLTWANIRAMEAQFPPGSRATDYTAWARHPQDAAAIASSLRARLPTGTPWRILQADICRRELLVEIEGSYAV